jgi:hypothetical protein
MSYNRVGQKHPALLAHIYFENSPASSTADAFAADEPERKTPLPHSAVYFWRRRKEVAAA